MNKRDFLTRILVRGMIVKGHKDLNDMHKHAKNARKVNDALLLKILKAGADSEYGKKYDFANIHSIEEFQAKVPLSVFADYEPYIDRMVNNNEENLLTTNKILGYAQTSGSSGQRKYIPISQPQIDIYTKYTITRTLGLADTRHKELYGTHLPARRGLLCMPGFHNYLPNGMPCSNVADIAARQLSSLYPYILTNPFKERFNDDQAKFKYVQLRFGLEDKEAVYYFAVFFHEHTEYIRYLKQHWQELCDDIEAGIIGDLAQAQPEPKAIMESFLKPNPERAAELRREFEKGFDETIYTRLWPNMSVLYGIGTASFTPFAREMRKYTKNIPYDFSIYGASEGLFGAVDAFDSNKYLLLVDSCFYEFIPVDEPDKILLLDELEEGKEYELVVTNQAGLYRYRIQDIVRVLGHYGDCPYIVFSYRKGQLLSITGEKTTEEHMADVVKAIGKEAGCDITEWAAFIEVDEQSSSHYVLLLENDKGIDLSQYSVFADELLKKVNLRYGYFHGYVYSAMQIRNQKPGSHDEWAQHRIETSGITNWQAKPVRVLDTPEKEEFFLSRVLD